MAKYASFVVDADTGKVYHAVNETTRNYPASLTKLMTLYLLFEAIDDKEISEKTRFTTSRRAAGQPPTRLGLGPGDTITALDAARALIIVSANDVATVVAEALGETETKFALKMTAKARKIGMSRTTFRNASGLPHRGQLSTAHDMATLAHAIMERFPQYYHLFAETKFRYGGRTYGTHNNVLVKYDGTDGLKTGYTHASGFNLITSVRRDGHHLIGVVFGGNTARSRDRHMISLLDDAFAEVENTPGPALVAEKPGAKPVVSEAQGDADGDAAGAAASPVWGIQVGAFYTRDPAHDTARSVASKFSNYLDGGQIAIMPLSKSRGRVLYRSRIIGLDKRDAYRACRVMERNKQPCLVVAMPPDQELAERL